MFIQKQVFLTYHQQGTLHPLKFPLFCVPFPAEHLRLRRSKVFNRLLTLPSSFSQELAQEILCGNRVFAHCGEKYVWSFFCLEFLLGRIKQDTAAFIIQFQKELRLKLFLFDRMMKT